MKQRAFAGTGRADDGYTFASIQGEVEAPVTNRGTPPDTGKPAAARSRAAGTDDVNEATDDFPNDLMLRAIRAAAELLEGPLPDADRGRFAASIGSQSRRMAALETALSRQTFRNANRLATNRSFFNSPSRYSAGVSNSGTKKRAIKTAKLALTKPRASN